MPASAVRARLSTRLLLICSSLAAVHLLLHFLTLPILTALAPLAPPVYGFVAAVHSIMPFTARRLTQAPGSASLTSGIASLFVAATNPSGIIVVVPLMLAGVIIDLVLWNDRGTSRYSPSRYLLAAVCVGASLFAVSLLVFSPAHLTPALIGTTLVGRVLGEVLVALLTRGVVAGLKRAGIRETA